MKEKNEFIGTIMQGLLKLIEVSNFDEMNMDELRQLLREKGLPVSGRKSELITRLKLSEFTKKYREDPNFTTLMNQVVLSSWFPDYEDWKENESLMAILHRLMAGEILDRGEMCYLAAMWDPVNADTIYDIVKEERRLSQKEKKHTTESGVQNTTEAGVLFSDVKGLGPLVDWATKAGKLFTPEARKYGFSRFPTGVLLTGVPGCGKTMIAQAIAQEWGMGFRRVFPDQLVGPTVGDNEKFMRELCDDLSQNTPIVCFIDEAEKILGQTRSPTFYRASDAGRDAAESILLQFMEEDDSGVFFVFTSNNFEMLSPALIDRFEERFFIDLPTLDAREDMISSMLIVRNRDPSNFDVSMLAELAVDFTGRDIRSAVDEAMKNAFCDNVREFTTADLKEAFEQVSPTAKIHKKEIHYLRRMVAGGKMRRANASEKKIVKKLDKN